MTNPEELVNKLRELRELYPKHYSDYDTITLAADLIEQQEKFRQSLTPKPISEAPRDGTLQVWLSNKDNEPNGYVTNSYSDAEFEELIKYDKERRICATHYLPLSALTALMPKG